MTEQSSPDYRENPHPRQTYRLEMRLENEPGEFGYVADSLQFNVGNTGCLPPPDSNPGGHTSPVPMHMIPLDVARRDDGVYEATVFTDGMMDEDYHGRGVCHWSLVNVQVRLKATGAEGETLFIAHQDGDDAVAGGHVELFFLKDAYPRHPESTLDDPLLIGRAGRASMAHLGDEELFKVTLSVSEPTP